MLGVHEPRVMLLQTGQITALACILFFDCRQLLAIGMKLTAAPVQHLLTVCARTVARQLALTFAPDQALLLLHALLHL